MSNETSTKKSPQGLRNSQSPASSCKGHTHGHEHGHVGHRHSHGHHHGSATGNIGFAFFLNFTFSIIELVGGMWVGSLAIVADAVHDFGDSVSLGCAWFLEHYANRKNDQRFNFGYRRFSLLSALISGVVVATGSIFIVREAILRFNEPSTPAALPMMALAFLGFAINGVAAYRLSRGETQNEKMLTWHLLEDVLGWAVVLVGALVIQITGAAWIDPLLAIGMAGFVSFNVIRNLRVTAYLFLQGRPENFDEGKFLAEAMAIEGIEKIDHLAIWSLDGESSVLSARLHLHSVRDPLEIERVKSAVRELAKQQKAQATLETCLAAHEGH